MAWAVRAGSAFLGKHWAARGYVCVFLQHPGSDTSVWKGKPPTEVLGAMRKAASRENLLLRVKDVRVVLDQLQGWNKQSGHDLYGRLDMDHVGMSGHSFGAVTTEAVSGQTVPGGIAVFTDPRIKAAVIFSPSSPPVWPARARGYYAPGVGSAAMNLVLIGYRGTLQERDRAPVGPAA